MGDNKTTRAQEAEKVLKSRKKKDQGLQIQKYLGSSASPEEALFKINEILYSGQYETTRKNVRAPVSLAVDFKVGDNSYAATTYTLSQKGAFIPRTNTDMVGISAVSE